ncbi:MAG: Extracellular ligand-binding receptor, partial [Deltaproteobacteria bacterium]|nr:Extracellular ligand-binding receptor [Deltaproteobacteria bacterium]
MKRLGIFALITVAILMVGYAQAQEKRDFFKVGVVTSLSGELAFGGTVTKRGYDMWEDAVNAAGGIDIAGKKYKV